MTVFEQIVRAESGERVEIIDAFVRNMSAMEQLADVARYAREQALMSEREIVDAVVHAMTAHAEEPARSPRTLLDREPPTVLQELALARIAAAYKANVVNVLYHPADSPMMAGYVEFSLVREGKHVITGGIDPNGRVST